MPLILTQSRGPDPRLLREVGDLATPLYSFFEKSGSIFCAGFSNAINLVDATLIKKNDKDLLFIQKLLRIVCT